ncbi:MAG: CAP domain-containing protein [Acidimicrobiia bacterium]
MLQVFPIILIVIVAFNGLHSFDNNEQKNKLKPIISSSSAISPLIRISSDANVYLVNGNQRNKLINQDIINDYSILGPVRTVDQSYFDSLTPGPDLGRIVKSSTDSKIYLLISGIKLLFSSCDLVTNYGADCNNLPEVSIDVLSKFVNGPGVTRFIKSSIGSTVYFIQNGKKRPVASWSNLVGLGFPIAINWLNDSSVNSIPTGELAFGSGGLIKTSSSASVYAINDWTDPSTIFPVTSFGITIDLGLGTDVSVVDNSVLSTYSIGANLRNTIKCGLNYYSGSNGILYQINPSLFAQFSLSQSDFLESGGICSRFTISQTQMSRFILNRGTIYFVENGTKRGFTSYRAYLENGGTPETTVPVSDSFVNRLPNGSPIVATPPRGESEIANDIYNRVNQERAARGLNSLGWDSFLNANARNWSVAMANSNSFAHSNLYPLLNRFTIAAENIGLAGPGAKSSALHLAWMNSTGHRVNLLAPNLDVIGIGVYCAPDGRLWVTQQFGRWPNSGLPMSFGPTPSVAPIVANDDGGATC